MPFLTTVLRTKKKLPLRRKSTGFTARKFPIYTNPLIPQVEKAVTERTDMKKELECGAELKKLLDCMKNNAFKDKDCANERTSFERCMKTVIKGVEEKKVKGYVVGETGGKPPTKAINAVLRRFKPPDFGKFPE